MICPKCKAMLANNATFCNRCLDGNNCYGCDNTHLLDRENGGKNIILR